MNLLKEDSTRMFSFLMIFVFLICILASVSADDDGGTESTTPTLTDKLKTAAPYVGGGAVASLGLSYLANSMLGGETAPGVSTNIQAFTQSLGAVGSLAGAIFGGPLGGALGGGLGAVGGWLAGAFVSANNDVSTIDRTITLTEVYLKLLPSTSDELINSANFILSLPTLKIDGSGQLTSINADYKYDKAYVKTDAGRKIQIIPIGFNKKSNMKDLESGIINFDYELLDVNKLVSRGTRYAQNMTWGDAKNNSKVIVKDQIVIDALEQDLSLPDNNFYSVEKQSFTLAFRNISPEILNTKMPNLNCFKYDGTLGATGIDAKPKVSFAWTYSDVGAKRICSNGIYCDATQLTLELIDRISKVNFSQSGTSSAINDLSYTLLSTIPGQALPLSADGTFNDNAIRLNIRNNTEIQKTFNISFYYLNTETSREDLAYTGDVSLSARSNDLISHPLIKTINDLRLPASNYKIKLIVKDGDETYTLFSDLLSNQVVVRTSDDVISSTHSAYTTLHFKANLMADGYTNDFLKDFKYDALYGQFLGDNLKNMDFIKEIFPDDVNASKIIFLPKTQTTENPLGYTLSSAGEYNVDIVFKYKTPNGSKTLINNNNNRLGENVEKIYIYLSLSERNNNPLYYLPLNGVVGIKNGTIERNGYGVEFKSNSSIVNFNNATNKSLQISPSLITNSNPLVSIEVFSDTSLETLNNTRKSEVLRILSAGTSGNAINRRVEFYPSIPMPIAMKLTKTSEGPAYGFYEISTPNGPVNTGSRMLALSQYCGDSIYDFNNYDCEYLDGSNPVDHQGDLDIIGSRARYAPTGQLRAYSYGFEVAPEEIRRDGKHNEIKYRSIFFANNATTDLKIDLVAASDTLRFESNQLNASQNAPALRTVEDVYNAVGTGWLCVSGSERSNNISFWWNPAMVFTEGKLPIIDSDIFNTNPNVGYTQNIPGYTQ